MKYTRQIAEDLQILADFCGIRDVDELNAQEVKAFFQKEKADLIVLFGGSIAGAKDLFAHALKEGVATASIIVGGYGHTTASLQKRMEPLIHAVLPTEAETFQEALRQEYGLQADFLEKNSTNCGNNITYLLDLIAARNLPCQNLIFIQDPSMQKRMDATLKRYDPSLRVLNYACTQGIFGNENGELILENPAWGMWSAEEYARLLMGEIQRLQDNRDGYGPLGKDFIAHVDIPKEVFRAYERLKRDHPSLIRKAEDRFATGWNANSLSRFEKEQQK